MSGLHIQTDDVKVAIKATATRNPDAIDLTNWPLLVHAPDQYGPGVWLEDGTTSVAEIVAAKAPANIRILDRYAALAGRFRTTKEHIRQALAYAAATQGK